MKDADEPLLGLPLQDVLKVLRRRRGYTQETLGNAHEDLSESHIAAMETGRRNAGPEVLEVLVDVLAQTPEEEEALRVARTNYVERRRNGRASTEERLSAVESDLAEVRRGVEEILRRLPSGDDSP